MTTYLSTHGRTLAVAGVVLALLALFGYVAVRSGPLAPIPVTLTTVERQALTPALFGIGTVEARYTHSIGPTTAGRLTRVDVQAGDRVRVGQVLGEMDPVDLDDRVGAQDAAIGRAEALVSAGEALVSEADARRTFANAQAVRYEQLMAEQTVSREAVEAKRQEQQVARAAWSVAHANLDVARQELTRLRAERAGVVRQRRTLRLVSPVDGLVTSRNADPGTTVVAGQSVVDVIDPASIWVNVRFDQLHAHGLRAGLPAQIVLRSQAAAPLAGRVARLEPNADPVTEEALAKVEFVPRPSTMPSTGELAEVTVRLAALPPVPVVPNASVQRVDGRLGVWRIVDGRLRFAPVTFGVTDLDGRVQVLEGLGVGDRVVVYSQQALDADSRITIVDRLAGASR